MPLVEALLKSNINTKFKQKIGNKIYSISYDAADKFQLTQEQVAIGFSGAGAVQSGAKLVLRKAASVAFATEMKKLKDEISTAMSEAVAESVDEFVKSATITTPPGQLVVTASAGGAGSGSTTSSSAPATIA